MKRTLLCLAATATLTFSQSLIDRTAATDILGTPFDLATVQVDARGDVYVAGTADLMLDSATAKIGSAFGNKDVWVVKMDPSLQRVLFKTVIGGSGSDFLQSIRVDSLGNVFVLGSTFSTDFPATTRITPGAGEGSFLLKLDATGSALTYSILFGKDLGARSIDLDQSGASYLGGGTRGGILPLTPGTYLPRLPEGPAFYPFILKMNAAGTNVEFATYVSEESGYVSALAKRSDGKLAFLVAAQPSTIGVLSSNGAQREFLVPVHDGAKNFGIDGADNFQISGDLSPFSSYIVERYSPSGVKLSERVFEGSFSQPSMQTSTDGKTYLEGMANAPAFPTRNTVEHCVANTKPPLGTAGTPNYSGNNNALVMFGSDGKLVVSTYLSVRVQAAALSPDGRYLYAAGLGWPGDGGVPRFGSEVARLDLSLVPSANHVAPACLAHGANYQTSPTSPGGIMTIYGSNLGPAVGVSFTVRDGRVPADLSGTRITVDGVPAPVLYTQDAQINFIVPWSTRTSGSVPVCVLRTGETACMDATADQVAPAPFWLGQTSVLNLDWSFNSADHPVRRGGYITVYFTGTGKLDGTLIDGAISSASLQRTSSSVTATIEGDYDPPCARFFGGPCPPKPQLPVEIAYAGSAPGLVTGVTQVNIRIPESIPFGNRVLRVNFAPADPGGATGLLVYIAP